MCVLVDVLSYIALHVISKRIIYMMYTLTCPSLETVFSHTLRGTAVEGVSVWVTVVKRRLLLTYPDRKVDLLVPLRILLIPYDRSPALATGKVNNAKWIHQLLLHCTNMEKLLHSFKISWIHLWHVLSTIYPDAQHASLQPNTSWSQ